MHNESRLIRIIADGNVYEKKDLLQHFTSEKGLNKTINNIKSYGLNLIEEGNRYQLEDSIEFLRKSKIYDHLSVLGCAQNIFISVKNIVESTSREFDTSDISTKEIKVSLAAANKSAHYN